MSMRTIAGVGVGVIAVVAVVWALSVGITRLVSPEPAAATEESTPPAPSDVAHISATIFYRAADDDWLVPVRRSVLLGTSVVEQGRQIVNMQLQPAPPPFVSAIPAGTTLRGFYTAEHGDAFVDIGLDPNAVRPGGSTPELLTVFAIVNAVTANLPSVTRVQILVDGHEVDSLAGHVDLRRPLALNLSFVKPTARIPVDTTTLDPRPDPDPSTRSPQRN